MANAISQWSHSDILKYGCSQASLTWEELIHILIMWVKNLCVENASYFCHDGGCWKTCSSEILTQKVGYFYTSIVPGDPKQDQGPIVLVAFKTQSEKESVPPSDYKLI